LKQIGLILNIIFLLIFQSGCGSTNSSSANPNSSCGTLTECYGTLIESSNINIAGKTLSGYSVTMSEYPSTTVASTKELKTTKREFVLYAEAKDNKRPDSYGLSLASATKSSSKAVVKSSTKDIYGLDSNDTLILATIRGGTLSDGAPLKGELYTIIPKSYLEQKTKPKINSLGTYAVMQVLRSNPSTKEQALEKLELLAQSFFDIGPDGGVENFASFNYFDPNDLSPLRDKDVYSALITSDFENAIISNNTAWIEQNILSADRDGDGVIAAIATCSDTNYQSDGFKGRDCFDTRAEIYEYLPEDRDGDFIPDDVEEYIGMDPTNWDENGNGVADGIDSAYDTYYSYQWHLKSDGTAVNNIAGVKTIIGNDLDLLDVQRKYMGYNDGNFTAIQVVDSGVEANHEDLSDNIDLNLSLNAVNDTNNPTPTESVNPNDASSPNSIGHGSACAGIIAARGFNQKGVRGISPFSKISGSNWIESEGDLNKLAAIWIIDDNKSSAKITVSNNSWGIGRNDPNDNLLGDVKYYDTILGWGTKLRDGKGRIYLFAAGNEREHALDSNFNGASTHRYSITVASLAYDNTYATYSNFGANLWLSGYGGGYVGEGYCKLPTIATTLLMGQSYYGTELESRGELCAGAVTFSNDSVRGYTYGFDGTSAATPTVAGSLALVLEACPELTQRDVKYLSAITAKKVDKSSSGWIQNSAGHGFSRDYGFGLVNPSEMIERCSSGEYTLLGAEKNTTKTLRENETVRIYGDETKSITFDIDEDIKIEYVYLTSDADMGDYTYLDMTLTSPSGTTIPIIRDIKDNKKLTFEDGARFGVSGFLDESSKGEWRLDITSKSPYIGITYKFNQLDIFGR